MRGLFEKALAGRTEAAAEAVALLDLAVEEDLKTEFAMQDSINADEKSVGEILKHPLTLIGASDGGAHTKFLTLGKYPTHFLAHWVRDKQIMTIEEAHWRLSTMLGWAIGIRDRGWLREGMPADIVVYDMEKLGVRPLETIRDLPDGDWRRVQKADGYRYTIVNGRMFDSATLNEVGNHPRTRRPFYFEDASQETWGGAAAAAAAADDGD